MYYGTAAPCGTAALGCGLIKRRMASAVFMRSVPLFISARLVRNRSPKFRSVFLTTRMNRSKVVHAISLANQKIFRYITREISLRADSKPQFLLRGVPMADRPSWSGWLTRALASIAHRQHRSVKRPTRAPLGQASPWQPLEALESRRLLVSVVGAVNSLNNGNHFIELISVTPQGTDTFRNSKSPAISGDGRYVCFESKAEDLVIDDTNQYSDIFIRDRQNLPPYD